MDQAVFVFGRHVELEVDKAGQGTKNAKQAEQKRMLRMKMLLEGEWENDDLSDSPVPVDPAPKKFRDPAELFKAKKG